VEDVAQAFGGTYAGRKLGAIGNVGAYSFFPSKNLGALGDGGLISTNEDRLADLCRMLRSHGSRVKYQNEQIGYNSRLDALQAAFLRVKLPHVDAWNSGRRDAAARYRELLNKTPGIVLPVERKEATHVYHQFTIRVLNGRRDALKSALAAAEIDAMVYYPKPAHQLPVYQGHGAFPVSEAASREVLSLPIWPRIPLQIQERIAEAIHDLAKR
jgi:dTDP-4-amino-4,6-dideoxygalactose transaminase